jgi:hypothetical protein
LVDTISAEEVRMEAHHFGWDPFVHGKVHDVFGAVDGLGCKEAF